MAFKRSPSGMNDAAIIDLYWSRSEEALAETEKKYGLYCHRIAYNILHSDEDAQECVNDTYLRAWNAIPPARPAHLGAYLGTITRRLALTRYEHRRAAKRYAGVELTVEELAECIPNGDAPIIDEVALREAINGFLASLPVRTRMIFLRKYWYLDDIKTIAANFGLTENHVKVILHRTREKFRAWLEKEGIPI